MSSFIPPRSGGCTRRGTGGLAVGRYASGVNAERLHAIANAIYYEIETAGTAGLVTELRDSLRAAVNDPSAPGPQQQVSNLRVQLNERLSAAPSNGFSPAWREALDEMGIGDLVGDRLGDRIEEIFDRNAITPSAAADELDPIVDRVQQLFSALQDVRAGLTYLQIGAEELEPGEVEIGFLIPRKAVKEDLELLGKEFIKLQQILGPFVEIQTGSREAVQVRTISSSGFAAFLHSTPAVALMVASTVERLIAAYKNVLDIRVARQTLKEAGASEKTIKSASDDADTAMSKAIAKLVTELMKEAKDLEPGRRNELRIELRVSLNGLANRIDQGYSIDVRVGELPPPPDEHEEDAEPEDKEQRENRKIVEQIQAKQESLTFTNLTGEPILSLTESTTSTSTKATKPATRRPNAPRQRSSSD